MSDVVVSCAGDTDLAKWLYDYMVSAYRSATDIGMISLNEDEIMIKSKELGIKNDIIQKSLSEFQASNTDLVGYSLRV